MSQAITKVPSPFIDAFSPIDAALLDERKLLRRVDTKFLASTNRLARLLNLLPAHYGILLAERATVARYQTLYFDTHDMRCFHDHRRGKRARHKVRVRHYVDRQVSYLEIKTKTNHDKTRKSRIARQFGSNRLTPDDREFIGEHCDLRVDTLSPKLWTNFNRISLVGLSTNERITIDMDLTFRRGEEEASSLPHVMIVEVKQSPFSTRTPVMSALRSLGLRPTSVSKYCTAIWLTRDKFRANRFMETFRQIERLGK